MRPMIPMRHDASPYKPDPQCEARVKDKVILHLIDGILKLIRARDYE